MKDQGVAGLRRFKPYPAYKDSGVEWLGKVPVHWEVKPNAALFHERDERGRDDLPVLEVSIAFGVRVREFSESKIEQRADDLGTYKVARTSDITFNKMRMWQGAVGTAPEDGLVSPDYVVGNPRAGTDSAYYVSVFRTALYMAEVYRHSHGIVDDRNRLYWDDFKAIRSPYPPVSEQQAIVAYLDREAVRIDALVAKALVRPSSRNIRSRWIAYCILSRVGQEQLLANLYGGTKDGLSLDDIRTLAVLVPPMDEQDNLVQTLDRACKSFDSLAAKVREAIDRLKEFRTALVSAAVTGKIDVRGEA